MSGNGEGLTPESSEAATEHLAVLGSPIAHSKSPAIHLAAYRELGLAWSYDRAELQPADLAEFLDRHATGWRGFSVTMPLKEETHRLAAILDPVAIESGVANTLLRLDSDAQRWAAFNTDVGGLAAAVQRAGLDATRTLVIGSGATAISAILAARRLGAQHVEILARNVEAIGELVSRFAETSEPGSSDRLHVTGTPLEGVHDLMLGGPRADPRDGDPTLVISTLPGPATVDLALPEALTSVPLFDVAYEPWPSPLAELWTAAGGTVCPGTEMLVEQALLQVRIFMNGDPGIPLEGEERVHAAMRAAADLPDMGG